MGDQLFKYAINQSASAWDKDVTGYISKAIISVSSAESDDAVTDYPP